MREPALQQRCLKLAAQEGPAAPQEARNTCSFRRLSMFHACQYEHCHRRDTHFVAQQLAIFHKAKPDQLFKRTLALWRHLLTVRVNYMLRRSLPCS